MADYSELRRLLCHEGDGGWNELSEAAVAALPGLLDEIERPRGLREHWSLNLQWELDHLRESDRYQRGRIAQLEAAIQELIEGGSMDEKDMLFAYAVLEGKEPTK